ncbi:MAG: hypothetical protein Q9160_008348 [Pyrenula sp. 1 TL-2023]
MADTTDVTYNEGYLGLLSNLGALIGVITCCAPAVRELVIVSRRNHARRAGGGDAHRKGAGQNEMVQEWSVFYLRRNGFGESSLQSRGLQEDGLQENGFQQGGLQEKVLRQHGIQQDDLQQHGIQQDNLQQHGIQQDGLKQNDLRRNGLQHSSLQQSSLQQKVLQKIDLQKSAHDSATAYGRRLRVQEPEPTSTIQVEPASWVRRTIYQPLLPPWQLPELSILKRLLSIAL